VYIYVHPWPYDRLRHLRAGHSRTVAQETGCVLNLTMPRLAHIHTFGCQMNVHDSERMAGLLLNEGYEMTDDESRADVIILNTCSVREKADQKFLSELGRLRERKAAEPDLRIVVAGCTAEQAGDALRRRFPHIDGIVGTSRLQDLPAMVGNGKRKSTCIGEREDYHRAQLPAERTSWPRAWVSIMYGCNNFCTYCIVPYTRGRERSRPAGHIIEEISALAKEGYREITLLGQNVNSYGRGGEVSFPELLDRVHRIEGIERIRFVTSHPKDLSPELIERMAVLEKVCPHIHLPLQSGSDRVLRAMNRRYTYAHYRDLVRSLTGAIPGIAVTTDLIVGFPGETEEDFQATLDAMEEVRFDGAFAFKYSPRPKTKAAELHDDVPGHVKQDRLSRLLKLQDSITGEKNRAYVGKTEAVLFDGFRDGERLAGRTVTNKIVHVEGPEKLLGVTAPVRIERALLHSLKGSLIT